MENEIWKDIPGYEGKYQASSMGNIRSLGKKGKILKGILGDRYLVVSLYKKGTRQMTYHIHSLVCKAFMGEKGQFYINHKNANKIDNRIENLEYCTPKENSEHAKNHGLMIGYWKGKFGELNPGSKKIIQKSLDGKIIKTFSGARDAERELGFLHQHISSCAKGTRKTAYKFLWEYV